MRYSLPLHPDVQNILTVISSMREQFNHHGPRVAGLAVKLAEACGMSREDIGLIAAGAALHDIGKIFTDPKILNKDGPLDTAERAKIQEHVAMGWAIVEQAGYEKVILDIVRSHHEKWDGTGYPDGLIGKEIPFVARLVCVCDVYQALTAKRVYREPHTHAFSRTYMEAGRGKTFDPELLDLFFEKVVEG